MDDFWRGVVLGSVLVLIVVIGIFIAPATHIDTVRLEGYEALEDSEVRVLMDDAIGVGEAVHFATTDGYFIYYDGALYREVK